MNRTICRRVDGAGCVRGGFVVAVVACGTENLTLAELPDAVNPSSWREAWKSAEPTDQEVSEEESLRGKDAKISSCLLADCQTLDEAMELVSDLGLMGRKSVYQLTGSLSAADL